MGALAHGTELAVVLALQASKRAGSTTDVLLWVTCGCTTMPSAPCMCCHAMMLGWEWQLQTQPCIAWGMCLGLCPGLVGCLLGVWAVVLATLGAQIECQVECMLCACIPVLNVCVQGAAGLQCEQAAACVVPASTGGDGGSGAGRSLATDWKVVRCVCCGMPPGTMCPN